MLSYIELFQGNLREFISEGLVRGSKYLPMIQEEFREQGLPLDLAYIPLIESAFKNTARSRVKAQGMWQFMRDTGLEHGLTQNWYIDERSDPEKATKAAAQYLKTLGKMFDGDWHLAHGLVQRRARPRAARHEAVGKDRFLDADGDIALSAARNARIRADDSRGDRHREEPRAVRLRRRAGVAARL